MWLLILVAAASTASALHCPASRSFRPTEGHVPTLLYSFEGSGNTRTRQLLESATGVYTGAIYTDPSLRKLGFVGEGVTNASVVVVKSHLLRAPSAWNKRIRDYGRMLQLVRNPYMALVAERKRQLVSSHVLSPSWPAFRDGTHAFAKQFNGNVETWDAWLRNHGVPLLSATLKLGRENRDVLGEANSHTARFEDLVEQPSTALRPVLQFLGYDPDAAACTDPTVSPLAAELASAAAGVRRTGQIRGKAHPEPEDLFPPCVYTVEQLRLVAEKLGGFMRQHGYGVPAVCSHLHHAS